MNSKSKLIFRILPIAAIICIVIVAFFYKDQITIENLATITPKSTVLAILFILLLYALKSLSIVGPLLVLYVLSGILFPIPLAILINFVGVLIELTIPFYIGRYSGGELIDIILKKYPKAQKISLFQHSNAGFTSFFLRVIGFLPCDVISLYLGACKLPFVHYLIGSVGGMVPGIVIFSIIGGNISDPLSTQFIICFAIQVILTVGSLLFYKYYIKKKEEK